MGIYSNYPLISYYICSQFTVVQLEASYIKFIVHVPITKVLISVPKYTK